MRRARYFAAACAALVAAPRAATAHTAFPGVDGFYSGIAHAFTTPEYVLALVTLGLVVGQRWSEIFRVSSISFAVALPVGLSIGFSADAVVAVGTPLIGTALVAAAMTAVAFPLPPLIYGVLSAATGALIGMGSVPEAGTWRALGVTTFGSVLAAIFMSFWVCGGVDWVTTKYEGQVSRIAVRIVASWAVAISVMMLTFRYVGRA